MQHVKKNDALARQRTMAILSPVQQEQAAGLESDARRQSDEERARRGREAGGDGRRGAGAMGRPPEE